MAIQATVETDAGESRQLYIRINNVEVNNHGAASAVLFRGYLSRATFEAGKAYVWERLVEVPPVDVSQNIWEQSYEALKAKLADPANPLEVAVSGAVVDVLNDPA